MPLHIQNINGKFCVVDPAGKKFGCHVTKKEAINQIAAIESSKKRQSKSGLDLVAEENVRLLAAELEISHGTEQPPIMVMSDGTPEGTMLMVYGQIVPFKRMEIWCLHDPDYSSCNFSVTMSDVGPDGMEIEKTFRLRKQPK